MKFNCAYSSDVQPLFPTGFSSSDLLEVQVPIYDQTECGEAYAPEPVTNNMICAGYTWGGRDACEVMLSEIKIKSE